MRTTRLSWCACTLEIISYVWQHLHCWAEAMAPFHYISCMCQHYSLRTTAVYFGHLPVILALCNVAHGCRSDTMCRGPARTHHLITAFLHTQPGMHVTCTALMAIWGLQATEDWMTEFHSTLVDVNAVSKGTRTGGIRRFTALVIIGNYLVHPMSGS